MVVLFLQYSHGGLLRHKVLFLFYAMAAILLYAGIAIQSVNNGWSYNVLFLVNISVFSWYFRSFLYSKRKRAIVTVCCAVNILLLLYFDVRGDFISDFNGYAYGVSFITIVLYTLFYFYQLLENVKEENLLLNFDFWLISGYLLYFLGSFFIVIYYENVKLEEKANIWGIQNGILFICSVITLLAYVWIRKCKKLVNE